MLKLSQIYLKVVLIISLILFIVLGIETYIFMKHLYLSSFVNLSNDLLLKKEKYFNQEFIKYILISFATLLFFLGIMFLYISKINKTIQEEVKKVISFLKNLTHKKKNEKIESNFSKEFKDITKLLSKISSIIIHQKDMKQKYIEELEYSNKQKDDIISAISHEFKNPIAVINGYSQTLLNEDLPKSIQKKFLLKIYNNGEKLTNLIDTLRLAMRIDKNTQKFDFVEVNLYELVSEVSEELKETYKNRNIIIQGYKDVSIKADKNLFAIVLSNLIENGLKYSEDDVIVKIYNDAISVIDKGIGIKESDIEKITQKFYRVSANSWNNSLGLGLFIVNNILKIHNFTLNIRSEINEGSEFIVRFK